MKGELAEAFKEFVCTHYVDKDPAQDFNHIRRIISRLEIWFQEASPIPEPMKLLFLACFHGLRAKLRQNEEFRSEVTGVLRSNEWDEEEIEDGFTSLFRHTRHPQSIEEKLVHDANNFERLGAFGIAKAFTTGGARGQTYEETVDMFEYQFLDKTVFHTPVANQYAQEGIIFAKEFLRRLKNELSI